MPGFGPLPHIRRLDKHAGVILINASGRAYTPNPAHSAVVYASVGQIRKEHINDILDTYNFDYAVLPVSWSASDCALAFTGWKTEQVYADQDFRGLRLTRDH